jgi:hypothetical protein
MSPDGMHPGPERHRHRSSMRCDVPRPSCAGDPTGDRARGSVRSPEPRSPRAGPAQSRAEHDPGVRSASRRIRPVPTRRGRPRSKSTPVRATEPGDPAAIGTHRQRQGRSSTAPGTARPAYRPGLARRASHGQGRRDLGRGTPTATGCAGPATGCGGRAPAVPRSNETGLPGSGRPLREIGRPGPLRRFRVRSSEAGPPSRSPPARHHRHRPSAGARADAARGRPRPSPDGRRTGGACPPATPARVTRGRASPPRPRRPPRGWPVRRGSRSAP